MSLSLHLVCSIYIYIYTIYIYIYIVREAIFFVIFSELLIFVKWNFPMS